jgi:hypothetical protein
MMLHDVAEVMFISAALRLCGSAALRLRVTQYAPGAEAERWIAVYSSSSCGLRAKRHQLRPMDFQAQEITEATYNIDCSRVDTGASD